MKLQKVIDKEVEVAKQLIQVGKKRQALIALKRKKYQESLLGKTEGMLLNLQEMVVT